MTYFTRRKGSKRLQARSTGGRYARPSLGANVCPDCGQIVLPEMDNSGPFPTRKPLPDDCPGCGRTFRCAVHKGPSRCLLVRRHEGECRFVP